MTYLPQSIWKRKCSMFIFVVFLRWVLRSWLFYIEENGKPNSIISYSYKIFRSLGTLIIVLYSGCQMDNWCAEVRWEWAVCIPLLAQKVGTLLSWLAGVALLQPGGREITALTEEVASAPAAWQPATAVLAPGRKGGAQRHSELHVTDSSRLGLQRQLDLSVSFVLTQTNTQLKQVGDTHIYKTQINMDTCTCETPVLNTCDF